MSINKFDFLPAIWIFASRDENHLISYQGIQDRLGLNDEELVQVKNYVRAHRELFRPGGNPEECRLSGLNPEDVFRSQFRVKKRAESSEVEIIQWGLEHIDRLRIADKDKHDFKLQKWQFYVLLFTTLTGLIFSIISLVVK